MKGFVLLAIAAAGYGVHSYNWSDCVKGSGDPVKKDLSVGAFHGVHVMGSLSVELTQAATQSVQMCIRDRHSERWHLHPRYK